MLKRLRKINKTQLIESSRRPHPRDVPVIALPKAYAALLAAGVSQDKAVLMVQDAATRYHSDSADLTFVVVWHETPYEKEWCGAVGW